MDFFRLCLRPGSLNVSIRENRLILKMSYELLFFFIILFCKIKFFSVSVRRTSCSQSQLSAGCLGQLETFVWNLRQKFFCDWVSTRRVGTARFGVLAEPACDASRTISVCRRVLEEIGSLLSVVQCLSRFSRTLRILCPQVRLSGT
jgi:hypothetical protein